MERNLCIGQDEVRHPLSIDQGELNGARRRAMFVLAAGGDPHRELELDSIELPQGWCLCGVEPELELDELVAVREVRGD